MQQPGTPIPRIKPPALQHGDTVGIVAPASNIQRDLLNAGCDMLRRLGYKPFCLESIFDQDLYFAGSAERRVRELEEMFVRDEVRAILCARGGYGSNYLLGKLNLQKIARHPKIFVGYSDNTTLLTHFVDSTGLLTFHGPMITKDFAHADGVDLISWEAALTGRSEWAVPSDSGMKPLVEGSAEGVLYGGCLSMLVASLGTPYQIRTAGTILFLEDVATKPFQIDRMLMQLKLAGKLESARGIIFGEMTDCVQHKGQGYTLEEAVLRVRGSDAAAYPPMSVFLESLGITVRQPFGVKNLEPRPDLVVVGNAISRGNVELEHVLDEHIPLHSLPQILHDEFLRGKEVLVVAGTHGKTTTTSMLAWIFHTAAMQPSFLVGGIAENFSSSFQLGQGKHFILEGDEYDTAFFDKGPKFLHYFPNGLILTSVEFDHADIYKDLDAVETAFKRLVNLVPRRGRIVAFDTGESLERSLERALCPVERYGASDNARWRVTDLRLEPTRTTWSVLRNGEAWANFEFALAGEYNVSNATAAAALAASCGISKDEIAAALKTFKSVKRRLEVRAQVNGVTIIDDFAHHPTAIAGTLTALRSRYPGARLWVILEPRSNTLRRNVLQKDLAKSLALADEVVVADVFKLEAIPETERLYLAALGAQVQEHGRRARIVPEVNGIVQLVAPEMRPGDGVAILSNGGFVW